MENFCNGMLWGIAAGFVAGSILAAKNKKFAETVKKGVNMSEEKFEAAKDFVEEKIEESKEKESGCCSPCDCEPAKFDTNKDLNKKYKN